MVVIGNKIINLQNENILNKSDKSILENTFTADELIFADLNYDTHTLCVMLAMKIATYKCIMKLGIQNSFTPMNYQVKLERVNGHIEGKVVYKNYIFFTKCVDDENFIRCVATNHLEKLNQIKSFHLKCKSEQTKIYSIITQKIQYYNETSALILHKLHENIPLLTNNDLSQKLEVSFSKTGQLYYISVLPEWHRVNSSIKEQNKNLVYA